jgi:NTE family protein
MQYEAAEVPEQLRRSWRNSLVAFLDDLGRWLARLGVRERKINADRSNTTSFRAEHRTQLDGGTRLSLALQGGGAHGAFTWGVLDRLLEEEDLQIDGISGTSAGALNAVALAAGYAEGGPRGARAKLEALWQAIVRVGRFSPLQPTALERLALGWNADGAFSQVLLDLWSRIVSPYQANPLGVDPLREILVKLIDFESLKKPGALRLFIAATRVESGASRIFTNAELSPDVVVASACLPTVHQAIRLDDGHYWDGGFSANPPLLPLVEYCDAADLVLVRLNPAHDEGVPVTASEIQARVNRIVFDAPLKRELDVLARLRRGFAESGVTETPLARRLAALRPHEIEADDVMRKLGASSKLHPDMQLVRYLNGVGRETAGRWIAALGRTARARRPANDNRLGAAV